MGRRCKVTGYDVPGSIRFFGAHAEDGKKKVGVELDEPVGKNNGTVKGHQYFACAKKHGVLVGPAKVQVPESESDDILFDPAPNASVLTSTKTSSKPKAPAAVAAVAGEVHVTVATPMGISFDGNGGQGHYVLKVKPDSNAAKTAKITPGMKFVTINNVPVAGKAKADLVAIIKGSPGPVNIVFQQDMAGFEAFVASKADPNEIQIDIVSPMGMSFDGNAETGFYVTKIKPGSNAEQTGKLSVGLKIDRVNSKSIGELSKADVVSLIKSGTGPTVNVVFKKDDAGYQAFRSAKETGTAAVPETRKADQTPAAKAAPETLPPGPTRKPKKKDVGIRCSVTGYDCLGTIKFFGPFGEEGKKKVGVEMDLPVGKHNGTVKGQELFRCAAKHGVLTAPSKVQVPDTTAPGGAPVGSGDGGKKKSSKKKAAAADTGGANSVYGVLAPGADASIICTYVSPRGKCKREVLGGTQFCEAHSCPVGSCSNGKGSQTPDCGKHTAAPAPTADDQFSTMSRLALIKELRGQGVDYKAHAQDVDKLRELCRGGGGGGASKLKPAKLEVTVPTPLGLSFDGYPGTGYFITKVKAGGNGEATGKFSEGTRIVCFNNVKVNGMVKKDIVQIVKDTQGQVIVEYKTDAKGFSKFKQIKADKDAAKNAPAASSGADEYEGKGRLQLIKMCREKNLEYKQAGKDVEALKALLRGS